LHLPLSAGARKKCQANGRRQSHGGDFNRDHSFVFSVASLAWLFDCLEPQFFNLARDTAMEDLLPSKALANEYAPYTTSVFLIGWAIDGVVFAALGDRYGRAKIRSFCVLLYSVSPA
jgi:MFS family permease